MQAYSDRWIFVKLGELTPGNGQIHYILAARQFFSTRTQFNCWLNFEFVEINWSCRVEQTERQRTTTTMMVDHSVSRSYLLAFQLTLVVSLTAAYYLHPSHLLKRKLGQPFVV